MGGIKRRIVLILAATIAAGAIAYYSVRQGAADVNARLLQAAAEDDTRSITKLLKAGADPNARDARDMTALHWLARSGNAKGVEMLLKQGADANAVDREGRTPLVLAAWAAKLPAVKFLLGAGARPNVGQNTVNVPLVIAIQEDSPDLVRLLLDKGADPNLPAFQGRTALQEAALAQGAHAQEIVKILREAIPATTQSIE